MMATGEVWGIFLSMVFNDYLLRDLCKTPPFPQSQRQVRILILEIFNPAVSGIPVVKILMCLDLERN